MRPEIFLRPPLGPPRSLFDFVAPLITVSYSCSAWYSSDPGSYVIISFLHSIRSEFFRRSPLHPVVDLRRRSLSSAASLHTVRYILISCIVFIPHLIFTFRYTILRRPPPGLLRSSFRYVAPLVTISYSFSAWYSSDPDPYVIISFLYSIRSEFFRRSPLHPVIDLQRRSLTSAASLHTVSYIPIPCVVLIPHLIFTFRYTILRRPPLGLLRSSFRYAAPLVTISYSFSAWCSSDPGSYVIISFLYSIRSEFFRRSPVYRVVDLRRRSLSSTASLNTISYILIFCVVFIPHLIFTFRYTILRWPPLGLLRSSFRYAAPLVTISYSCSHVFIRLRSAPILCFPIFHFSFAPARSSEIIRICCAPDHS